MSTTDLPIIFSPTVEPFLWFIEHVVFSLFDMLCSHEEPHAPSVPTSNHMVLRPQAGIPCATPLPSLENYCQDIENNLIGTNIELVCGSIRFFLVMLLTCSYFFSAETTYVAG